MSTYAQSFRAINGIDGKTLKEKFIEDNLMKQKANGEYTFDKARTGLDVTVEHDFMGGTCFSEDGNSLSCIFDLSRSTDYTFIGNQKESAKKLSELYPGTTFQLHSSYCAGGCGFRQSCIDEYVTDGRLTDSKGVPCYQSTEFPQDWIAEAGPEFPDFYCLKLCGDTIELVKKEDVEIEDGWCKMYMREYDDEFMEHVFDEVSDRLDEYMEEEREADYRAMLAIDNDEIDEEEI
jgi:hypothetical protein